MADTHSDAVSVLLVDDDILVRRVSKALLEASGHAVVDCASGDEALDVIQLTSFDIVLIDINMPGMNGLETTRRIRALAEKKGEPPTGCRIVALTATAAPEVLDHVRWAGMDGVLIKPLRRGMIERELGNIAARRDATSAGAETGDTLIDRARLQAIADVLPRHTVHNILRTAGSSIAESAIVLRQAWHDDDRQMIAQCAHRLAGAAGNFGGKVLASVAREIETECKSGGTGKSHAQHFEQVLEATLSAMRVEWEEDR